MSTWSLGEEGTSRVFLTSLSVLIFAFEVLLDISDFLGVSSLFVGVFAIVLWVVFLVGSDSFGFSSRSLWVFFFVEETDFLLLESLDACFLSVFGIASLFSIKSQMRLGEKDLEKKGC